MHRRFTKVAIPSTIQVCQYCCYLLSSNYSNSFDSLSRPNGELERPPPVPARVELAAVGGQRPAERRIARIVSPEPSCNAATKECNSPPFERSPPEDHLKTGKEKEWSNDETRPPLCRPRPAPRIPAILAPRNPWTRPERREFARELNSTAGNFGNAPFVGIGRRDERFDPLGEEIIRQ